MAREYAQVWLAIWADDDFRKLSPAAQHLYFVLLTSRSLTHCGVADWRPAKIAGLATPWTGDDVEQAGKELAAGLFVVIDDATEEVLLRTFIKHDGPMRNSKNAVSVVTAHEAIGSARIRGVIVRELQKLHLAQPALAGWKGKGVLDLLERDAFDIREHPGSPIGSGSDASSDRSSLHPSDASSDRSSDEASIGDRITDGSADEHPSDAPPHPLEPDPDPGTSSKSPSVGGPGEDASQQAAQPDAKPKRGTRLPDDWRPSQPLIEAMQAECPAVDLIAENRKFADHFRAATGRNATKLDWDATWRNWMREARDRRARPGQQTGTRHIDAQAPRNVPAPARDPYAAAAAGGRR